MTMHPGETRLNDYLDRELDARDAADVEAHLAGCASCRIELERVRAIVDGASHLADAIEPRRDLWTAIESRIDAAGSVDLDARRERSTGALWAHRYQLAAAATLLVLAASTGTFLLMRGDATSSPIATIESPAASSPVQLASLPGQADYVEAIQELDALLAEREGQLDPQTAEVVRRNMAIIDQAIRDAQAALATDPANGDLNRAVSAAYKTKINLLRRAVELPART